KKMFQVDNLVITKGLNELGDQELGVAETYSITKPHHYIQPILMQYTGLKDSQLIEEYYGDIIISTFDGGDEWELFVIEDGLSAVLFRNIDTDEIWYFWQMPICYVIGNIYSYPELIK
ncbi:hypothetical protein LCGC14_3121760, partial [marine sediment metagenome]